MSAGWVAGSVRAAAMARRRLGPVQVRALATSPSLHDALVVLSRTPYGRGLSPQDGLAAAEHRVATTLLWHVRVLAGWLPPRGAEMLRSLAAWFEIANIDDRLLAFTGPEHSGVAPFQLGGLATAWPRLAGAGSLSELRGMLAASAWGDPGEESAAAVSLWLRLSWAERVVRGVGPARSWAAGAAALMVARERFARGRTLTGRCADAATRLLGTDPLAAAALPQFGAALPPAARWAVAGVAEPDALWRAEAGWWRRLHRDGLALLNSAGFGPDRPLGAVAVLAVDAWRVRAALEGAARGGAVPEVLDAAA